MNQRSPWVTTLIVLLAGGAVLACLGLAAALVIGNSGGQGVPDIAALLAGKPEAPTITIVRPSAPQTLTSGEGVMLLAQVHAEDGIERVEFLVDNAFEKQAALARTGVVDEEVRFVWFASKAGNHVLSLVAYDNGGQASTPASLTMMVEQNRRAFELEAEAQQAAGTEDEESGGEAEAAHEAGEGEESEPAGEAEEEAEAPLEEAVPEEEAAPEEAEPETAPEEPPEPEEAEPEDAVPVMDTFDLETVWSGGDVDGVLHLEATDDQGLMAIVVDVLNDDGESSTLVEFCSDALDCTADFSLPMHDGDWMFGAQAYDNAGQVSTPWVEERQVLSLSGFPPILMIYEVFIAILPEEGDPPPDPFDLGGILEIIMDFEIPVPWLKNYCERPVAAFPVEPQWRNEL